MKLNNNVKIIEESFSDESRPHSSKSNILVIWGDDVGIWNLSTYNMGMMGYRTPNIDRIAIEGMKFTDYYGEQSCTAGRSAFITGQSPIRTLAFPPIDVRKQTNPAACEPASSAHPGRESCTRVLTGRWAQPHHRV